MATLGASTPMNQTSKATDLTLAELTIRQRPAPLRRAALLALICIIAFAIQSIVRNGALQWNIVGQYLFDHRILAGVWVTIQLTVLSMTWALISAVVIAVMRLSRSRSLRTIAFAYVWFFRSVPVLVLLIIVDNFSLLYPHASLGVPFGPSVFSVPLHQLVTPFLAAVLAFGLNEAAYASEILRSAILAIGRGQWDAGTAVAMTRARIYRRIVLPQALRIAVPPLTNDTINMLKGTSLVAFIGVFDLLYTAQAIYAVNYEVMPLLLVACLWYVFLVTIMTIAQALLERYLRRVPKHGVQSDRREVLAA